ncbi:DNA polymerase III subunit alpha [Paenibacillus sp. FSL R7-0302]|uniref:DNA polymerase III subunit alpha n=1 Tax=Paenibacillus sp. FSL R7-0302 TaxID=2921681 RepID=UPI004046A1E0
MAVPCSCCHSDETFVNLHLHTAYSLLDGMSRPEDVVKKVKSMNQKGFAVTEHGNVHSSVKMYKLAKENSLKFIYGCEFYICDNRFEKDKNKKYYHLTVLAKNEKGRLNINKLVSFGFLEGFYYKPRIDFALLEEYGEGLIILSGCMASELQQTLAGGKIQNGGIEILSGNVERAKEVAIRYRKAFGEDYYLEVQSHREQSQQDLNRAITDIAHDLGIQIVATADSHFVNEEDLELHSIFIAINRNQDSYESDTTYMDTQIQSEKEAWNLLQSLTEDERDIAIRNTSIIMDKCNVTIPLSAALIPKMNIPPEFGSQEDFLKHLCNKGWIYRKINRKDKRLVKKYKDRLMYEFEAVSEMGFAGYYLLVHGYANSVERRGIARGSGGGSLIAYLLNIVDIDPIEHGLYFERFIDVAQLDLLKDGVITKEELKIPDFDLDFAPEERDLIVKNIVEEHGQERVAALGQFGYIKSKSAIKDVGRVLNIPFEETNEITKHMDDDDESIEGAMLTNLAMKQYEKKYPKLFEYAKKLEGIPRSYGMHPCGKVVTIEEVLHYTAISENEGEMVLHLDMKDAEALGLVKVDLLGLRTISVIYDTLHMIGKDVEYIRNLDYTDDDVLSIFKNGFTDGIFQFESEGMKSALINMQPTCLDDLSAVNALYRPGSMKYINDYINRKNGLETFEYLHADLEAILKNTYGIIVFQEQLIEIGRLAKLRNPDLLRQATGKKDIKKLNKVEPELRQGLYDRGWTKEQVDTLWEIMLEFAKYSFNKSHSQSYAIIAFICAMLKKRHPLEFMCAWYNSLEGHHKKLETCHKEMKRLGVKINKADFRSASPVCVIENGALTYGLTLLKHCNRQIAEDLSGLSFRKYSRFIELLIDIKEHTIINSKQLDILIRLGYFSEFGSVPRLLTICKEFTDGKIKYSKTHKDKTKVKRIEALSAYEDTFNNDSLKKFSPMEIILFEREIYGFIHSVFPLVDGHVVGVLEIDMKYTPKVKTIIFRSGEILEFKVRKDKYFGRKDIEAFTANDTIKIKRMSEREKMKKTDDGWQGTGVNEYYLEQCSLVK